MRVLSSPWDLFITSCKMFPSASWKWKTSRMHIVSYTIWMEQRHRLKMHATPMVIMRKSMIASENQQSPAQAELYGMKHGLTTANINFAESRSHNENQWTPMQFSMHSNPNRGRSWNNTPCVFRAEANDHQRTSKSKPPVCGYHIPIKFCSKP